MAQRCVSPPTLTFGDSSGERDTVLPSRVLLATLFFTNDMLFVIFSESPNVDA